MRVRVGIAAGRRRRAGIAISCIVGVLMLPGMAGAAAVATGIAKTEAGVPIGAVADANPGSSEPGLAISTAPQAQVHAEASGALKTTDAAPVVGSHVAQASACVDIGVNAPATSCGVPTASLSDSPTSTSGVAGASSGAGVAGQQASGSACALIAIDAAASCTADDDSGTLGSTATEASGDDAVGAASTGLAEQLGTPAFVDARTALQEHSAFASEGEDASGAGNLPFTGFALTVAILVGIVLCALGVAIWHYYRPLTATRG